jgi:sporulation protein YlmC with PRC-barrel domain
MKTLEDVQTWRGMKVVDADGDKIGTIEQIYLDRQSGEPEWATVKTGLFGLKTSFVPIRDAEVTDDGAVRVPVQKEQVKDAPRIEPEGEELSPDQERQLWEHYGRSDYEEWQGEDRTTALDLPAEGGGRFERTGGDGEDIPAIVGVRLRRYVVVVVPPGGAAAEADENADR